MPLNLSCHAESSVKACFALPARGGRGRSRAPARGLVPARPGAKAAKMATGPPAEPCALSWWILSFFFGSPAAPPDSVRQERNSAQIDVMPLDSAWQQAFHGPPCDIPLTSPGKRSMNDRARGDATRADRCCHAPPRTRSRRSSSTGRASTRAVARDARALHAELDRLAADESVRVVIVTGAGRAFLLGA